MSKNIISKGKDNLPNPTIFIPDELWKGIKVKYVDKKFTWDKFKLPDGKYSLIPFNNEYDMLFEYISSHHSPNKILEELIKEDVNLGFFPKKIFRSRQAISMISNKKTNQLFSQLDSEHIKAIFEFKKNKIRNVFLNIQAFQFDNYLIRKSRYKSINGLNFFGIDIRNYIAILEDIENGCNIPDKFFFKTMNCKKISFIASSGLYKRNLTNHVSWKGEGNLNEIKWLEKYTTSEKNSLTSDYIRFFKRSSFKFLNSKKHGNEIKFSAYNKVLAITSWRFGAKDGWQFKFTRNSNVDPVTFNQKKVCSEDVRDRTFYSRGKKVDNPFIIVSALNEM